MENNFEKESADDEEFLTDTEYEMDPATKKKRIKCASPRRMITELFDLSVGYFVEYFDTFPMHTESEDLLRTLIKIYNSEEDIYIRSVQSKSKSDQSSVKNDSAISSMSNPPSHGTCPNTPTLEKHGYMFESVPGVVSPFSLSESSFFDTGPLSRTSSPSICSNLDMISRRDSESMNSSEMNANLDQSRKVRALKIISFWASKYYMDFQNNNDLKHFLLYFLDKVVENAEGTETNVIRDRASQILSETEAEARKLEFETKYGNKNIFYEINAGSNSEKQTKELDSKTMATEMTNFHALLQQNVNIREFLTYGWSRANKYEITPTIMKITDHFNKTTRTIQTMILNIEKASRRAKAIEFWLDVANHMINMQNYCGMLMINSALESSCIYRLQKTWGKVSKKYKTIKENMIKLANPAGNYSNLRALYQKEVTLPYLGTYLSELIYIDEFRKLFVNKSYIEFKNMRSISRLIRSITKSMTYYNKLKKTEPQLFLAEFYDQHTMNEEELMKRSITLEPE